MASSINASTSGAGGVITTADNSGILQLQSGGTTVATVGPSGLSTPAASTINTANTFGFKNRLMNGSMWIDQRNSGASVTPSDGQYTLDRWCAIAYNAASKFSVQQTPSTTETGYATRVAAGFQSYLAATSTSNYTIGAGEICAVYQRIEALIEDAI